MKFFNKTYIEIIRRSISEESMEAIRELGIINDRRIYE